MVLFWKSVNILPNVRHTYREGNMNLANNLPNIKMHSMLEPSFRRLICISVDFRTILLKTLASNWFSRREQWGYLCN